MNVGELIEELKKQDPEIQVRVGVPCSCYGIAEATELSHIEASTGILKTPEHILIE